MRPQQEVMCVLLKCLRERGMISETIHDKARSRILDTLDWPEYFCYAEDNREEEANGSA